MGKDWREEEKRETERGSWAPQKFSKVGAYVNLCQIFKLNSCWYTAVLCTE